MTQRTDPQHERGHAGDEAAVQTITTLKGE